MGHMIQCSEMVNFNCTKADSTSKGGEFSQQFNGAIKTSPTASYDDVRRWLMSQRNLLHMHKQKQGQTQSRTKWII